MVVSFRAGSVVVFVAFVVAVISRPGTFSKVVQAVISRSRGAGGSGQRPSSPATEDNCSSAVLRASGVQGPGITAGPLCPERKGGKGRG